MLLALLQVDLDCLSETYRAEQRDYYLSTSAWAEVHPAQLLGPGVLIKSYDLNTVTLQELQVWMEQREGRGTRNISPSYVFAVNRPLTRGHPLRGVSVEPVGAVSGLIHINHTVMGVSRGPQS